MTLDRFMARVDKEISLLTNGTLFLAVMPDFADGDCSLSEMHEEGITPREAAKRILFEVGMEDALNCWSTECDYCEFEYDCPHIG